MTQAYDFERRFGGIARLYGNAAFQRFRQAHVCVVGIGGVGSWAAEALARSAVGRMTLIDPDNIAESNVNRQIHALGDEFGKAKVTAMAERIHAINPQCQTTQIEDFVTPDNVDALLGQGCDLIIDAIDSARTKAAMIAWCKHHQTRLIVSGGAGGRLDPAQIRLDDLARTSQDPLLARVRSLLRREYGFPKEAKKKFGVPCVFSSELLQTPDRGACETTPVAGLNCAGYGSSMAVTATFGLLAAASALRQL